MTRMKMTMKMKTKKKKKKKTKMKTKKIIKATILCAEGQVTIKMLVKRIQSIFVANLLELFDLLASGEMNLMK
jgi:hypothetical protein